ncbi:hypothetical protein Tco_1345418 [Tanacetum coccineum]
MDYQCTQPSEIEIYWQAEEIERQREYKRLEIEREKSMQEFADMFKEYLERMNIQRKEEEKRIFEEAARQEEEKRIAEEKEAAAKCKIQECLNIEEKSIPQASTRSRKFRIDPTLSNFTISTKRIPLSDFEIPPVTPNVETVNSLSMGDKHLDTSKDSLESSVKDPIPIPSESNDTSNGAWNSLLNDDKFQKALNDWCNLAQQNSMLSIYDENNKIRDCYKLSPSAITPDLPITDSLIMEDEHLDTIPVTESANTIKSSVDDLVPTPSESADLSDGEIIFFDILIDPSLPVSGPPDDEICLILSMMHGSGCGLGWLAGFPLGGVTIFGVWEYNSGGGNRCAVHIAPAAYLCPHLGGWVGGGGGADIVFGDFRLGDSRCKALWVAIVLIVGNLYCPEIPALFYWFFKFAGADVMGPAFHASHPAALRHTVAVGTCRVEQCDWNMPPLTTLFVIGVFLFLSVLDSALPKGVGGGGFKVREVRRGREMWNLAYLLLGLSSSSGCNLVVERPQKKEKKAKNDGFDIVWRGEQEGVVMDSCIKRDGMVEEWMSSSPTRIDSTEIDAVLTKMRARREGVERGRGGRQRKKCRLERKGEIKERESAKRGMVVKRLSYSEKQTGQSKQRTKWGEEIEEGISEYIPFRSHNRSSQCPRWHRGHRSKK